MTNKQKILYEVIKKFIDENGYSPTVRELNKLTNIKSPSTTFNKLKQLKRQKYISYEAGKSRTIKILK